MSKFLKLIIFKMINSPSGIHSFFVLVTVYLGFIEMQKKIPQKHNKLLFWYDLGL